MDISSPPVLAAIITIFSTFLFTQVIGRIIDHNYDKNYRELERNLQLKKLLGEPMQNKGLDELIRIQLNSYILIKSSSTTKTRWHRFLLVCIGILVALSLMLTVTNFQNHMSEWGVTCLIVTFALCMLYFDRRKVWLHRSYVENTKYRAEFFGGEFDGKHFMVDIKQADGVDNLSTLDHPFVYIENTATNTIFVYKRVRSSGSVSVSSGENTNLITDYAYQGIFDQSEGRKMLGKNPIIPSTAVRSADSILASIVASEEVQVIAKPILGTVSYMGIFAKFIMRIFGFDITRKSNQGESINEQMYTGALPRIVTGTQPAVPPRLPERDSSAPATLAMPVVPTTKGTIPVVEAAKIKVIE
jgi:hypothetical protein